jgi:hypothetical protein
MATNASTNSAANGGGGWFSSFMSSPAAAQQPAPSAKLTHQQQQQLLKTPPFHPDEHIILYHFQVLYQSLPSTCYITQKCLCLASGIGGLLSSKKEVYSLSKLSQLSITNAESALAGKILLNLKLTFTAKLEGTSKAIVITPLIPVEAEKVKVILNTLLSFQDQQQVSPPTKSSQLPQEPVFQEQPESQRQQQQSLYHRPIF